MTTVLQPEVTISLASADREVSNKDQKVLVVAQKTSAGSATVDVIESNLSSIGSPEDAWFGIDSMAASIVRHFRDINPLVQVDVIPLADNGSTFRTVTITVVGTATAAGTLICVAGSEKDHRFTIAVANADTPTIIAAAIAASLAVSLLNT